METAASWGQTNSIPNMNFKFHLNPTVVCCYCLHSIRFNSSFNINEVGSNVKKNLIFLLQFHLLQLNKVKFKCGNIRAARAYVNSGYQIMTTQSIFQLTNNNEFISCTQSFIVFFVVVVIVFVVAVLHLNWVD